MLVYLGTEKQLPLPTRRLHLGPLLSTRESIVISSHGCFKFTSGIYNPFLSNQSEQNHTKYIHSLWMRCPTKNQHLFGHERCCFFFRCFLAPKKTRRRNPGGLSSLLARGDGAEVPLVGLRNDACGTSRRPVDGGEEVLPRKPIGVFFPY